jgi:ankyrin repeat protein
MAVRLSYRCPKSEGLAIVKLLAEAGAPLDTVSSAGQTALAQAVATSTPGMVCYLINMGAATDIGTDSNRETPLYHAVWRGYMDKVKCLLEAGAEIDIVSSASDRKGATPLLKAVKAGKLQIAMSLVRAGAGLDHRGNDGRTALHLAASGQYCFSCSDEQKLDLVKLLVEAGARYTTAPGHTG